MKKNQILPVLGAGGDGAAAGQQHPRGASHRASPNPQQHLAASTRTTCQVPPRSHVICSLLPCPGSDQHEHGPALGQNILAQPAVMPTSARSPAWSISPGLILAARSPSSLKSLSRVHCPSATHPPNKAGAPCLSDRLFRDGKAPGSWLLSVL